MDRQARNFVRSGVAGALMASISVAAFGRDLNEIDRLLASTPVFSAPLTKQKTDLEICLGIALAHGMWPSVLRGKDRTLLLGFYEADNSPEWVFDQIAITTFSDRLEVRVVNPKVWDFYRSRINACLD
jgi:hypothetical protein